MLAFVTWLKYWLLAVFLIIIKLLLFFLCNIHKYLGENAQDYLNLISSPVFTYYFSCASLNLATGIIDIGVCLTVIFLFSLFLWHLLIRNIRRSHLFFHITFFQLFISIIIESWIIIVVYGF